MVWVVAEPMIVRPKIRVLSPVRGIISRVTSPVESSY